VSDGQDAVNLTPVRIEFRLRTPMVVPSTGKHLDALLSWAAVQQAEFEGALDSLGRQYDIGLARHHAGNQWCFMASLLDISWRGNLDYVHYIKRSKPQDYVDAWDAGLFNRKKPGYNMLAGSTKAGSYIQPLRWVDRLTGYAMAEDMDRVRQLLPWVTHIGKLIHKDYGAVSSFSVEVDEKARQEWPRRFLPVCSPQKTPAHVPAAGTLSPPYWKREKFEEILIPCDN